MPRVLSFHYTLKNKQGEVLDSSRGGAPFPVLEGARQIIPGLEREIFKLNSGDRREIEVLAAEAYGPVNEELRITVQRNQLPEGDIPPGTRFRAGQEHGSPVFTVVEINGEEVVLDGNHPLAGVDLVFDVEVTEIREATADEQTHGHAHGPEGHHH